MYFIKKDLPKKIELNHLVYSNTNKTDCNTGIITRIDFGNFGNGIPDHLFLECKDGLGDIYSFERARN